VTRRATKYERTNDEPTNDAPESLKTEIVPFERDLLGSLKRERREIEEEPSPSLPLSSRWNSALFVLVPPMETGCPPPFPPQGDPS